jgi:hypothetical protein
MSGAVRNKNSFFHLVHLRGGGSLLRLSISDKASSVKTSFGPPLVTKAGSRKAHAASVGRIINMLDSSASEGEANPLNSLRRV